MRTRSDSCLPNLRVSEEQRDSGLWRTNKVIQNGKQDEYFWSKLERIESSAAIPSSILNSENSLLDEVQHLYSPTCSITKIPHLILDLVPVPQARTSKRSPSSSRLSSTTSRIMKREGTASFLKNLSSIATPMSYPRTTFMRAKN